MKKPFLLILPLLFFAWPACADIIAVGEPPLKITSPDTLSSVSDLVCDEWSTLLDYNDPDHPTFYYEHNCGGTHTFTQFWPVTANSVVGLSGLLSEKLDEPAGATSQYLRGDGSLATFPTNLSSFTNGPGYITSGSLSPYLTISSAAATYFPIPSGTGSQYLDGTGTPQSFTSGSRTFNHPSRALASCFQVSSTQDADVNYSVDISATLTLGGGTGVLTSYTNSGCTTGAQALANGAVSSVALLGTSSIPLHATFKAGTWLKIAGTATGGGSAAIDAVQSETLLP